jgi:hypothetical protein
MLGAALLLAGEDSYSITNSIRLNGTSDYLSRTFTTPTSAYIGTLSMWFKRGSLGADGRLFEHSDSSTRQLMVRLDSSTDTITVDLYSGGVSHALVTSQVFRDPSAWYHLVLAVDTTQATAANRTKLYINGSQASFSSSTYQDQNTTVFGAWTSRLGTRAFGTPTAWYSGYYSDTYFIDGQALTPSSFGQTDANGVWVPIRYAGTYGVNGVKLAFGSSGSLGSDTSGNANDWTVNGSPVQTTDTPTNNYATLNAVRPSTSALTIGNTTAAGTASGTIPVSQSDKWYWEVTANAVGVNAGLENTSGTTYTQSVTNGTTTGFRYTHSTTALEYTTNGSSWSTVSSAVSGVAFPYVTGASSTTNFGATALAYATPSGFELLTASNLPSTAVTTSGTFTGNANANGPFIWTNGNPATLTINGNAVTFGTHADKTAGGFKLRSSSASYNTSGSNTWTATAGKRFVYSATSINTAQGNP